MAAAYRSAPSTVGLSRRRAFILPPTLIGARRGSNRDSPPHSLRKTTDAAATTPTERSTSPRAVACGSTPKTKRACRDVGDSRSMKVAGAGASAGRTCRTFTSSRSPDRGCSPTRWSWSRACRQRRADPSVPGTDRVGGNLRMPAVNGPHTVTRCDQSHPRHRSASYAVAESNSRLTYSAASLRPTRATTQIRRSAANLTTRARCSPGCAPSSSSSSGS